MVLVVDDDVSLARLLETALQKEGYRVETAANGVEAYKKVQSPDCKCMLLDINMPQLNGVELLMLMQAEGIAVPTIVMAGFPDFNESEMKQFESVVAFLGKPFSMEKLAATIKSSIKGKS